jgi:hypothetical protein
MINKERVQLLVDALRSGRYKQGRGKLRTPDERYYCCLGVATKIALDAGLEVEEIPATGDPLHGQPWRQAYQVMCPTVADWYGFDNGNPGLNGITPAGATIIEQASRWNDDYGADFTQIADMFENTYIRETVAT